MVCFGFLDFFIFFPPPNSEVITSYFGAGCCRLVGEPNNLEGGTGCAAGSSGGGIFISVDESVKSLVDSNDEDEPNAVGAVDAFDAAESCPIDTFDAGSDSDVAGFSNAFDAVDASGRGSTSDAGEPNAVDASDESPRDAIDESPRDAVDESPRDAVDESPRDAIDSSDDGSFTGDTDVLESVDVAGNSSTSCVASCVTSCVASSVASGVASCVASCVLSGVASCVASCVLSGVVSSFEPNKPENHPFFFSSGFSETPLSSVCDSDCDLAYFSFNSFILFAFSDRSIIPLVNSSHKFDISFCNFLSATFLLCSNNGESKEPKFILYI